MPITRLSQDALEVLHRVETGVARASQDVVEVLWAFTAPSAPAISGARHSQDVLEVLHQVSSPDARVSHHVVEILLSPAGSFDTSGGGEGEPGGGIFPSSFGYVT